MVDGVNTTGVGLIEREKCRKSMMRPNPVCDPPRRTSARVFPRMALCEDPQEQAARTCDPPHVRRFACNDALWYTVGGGGLLPAHPHESVGRCWHSAAGAGDVAAADDGRRMDDGEEECDGEDDNGR